MIKYINEVVGLCERKNLGRKSLIFLQRDNFITLFASVCKCPRHSGKRKVVFIAISITNSEQQVVKSEIQFI
jgi:hypothetical protein